MSHPVVVELSDAAYAALELRAREASQSPSAVASAALEQHFAAGTMVRAGIRSDAERKAARERFERHFGAVNLGHPTGADNESIDADLRRSYGESHEVT